MIGSIGNSRIVFLLLLFVNLSLNCLAQSSADAEKEKVIIEVRKQLVAMTSPGGELHEICLKKHVSGDFVVDLTIGAKGRTLTVFMVSSNPENIANQNFLKSQLSDLRFDVEIPKTQRVKFRHTLILNP